MGYYGIRVHESVLKSGDRTTGATVHFVDAGADTGAVIMQKEIEVLDSDTPETLSKRVLEVEHTLLSEAVRLFCADKISLTDGKAVVKR
jgi:phosphoribosylglycinamide formyltransferase-1